MTIQSFEDIQAWQKANQHTVEIYRLLKNNRDFGFKDQLQRAAVSVTNNIAEGFERKSNKELTQFLYVAKGSCGEVRSMLHLARELNYITNEEAKSLIERYTEVSKMLSGFIKKL